LEAPGESDPINTLFKSVWLSSAKVTRVRDLDCLNSGRTRDHLAQPGGPPVDLPPFRMKDDRPGWTMLVYRHCSTPGDNR
jgi:hypothetical protein